VNGTRVEVITYDDGLSSFSVFSEKLSGKAPRTGQSQRGSTAMVSRVLAADGQSWLLTVVGELPLASVQRIADSLQVAMP
jgi:sigma-E factor negative regulatory protein RseB